jgi:hypothetical protein
MRHIIARISIIYLLEEWFSDVILKISKSQVKITISRWASNYWLVQANRMMYSRMVEPIGAVMQRKMLKETKKLGKKSG